MKHTQRILTCAFTAPIVLALLLVLLFETDLLPYGTLTELKHAEFITAIIMELLTIAVIPLALKLFKLRPVAARLNSPGQLARFGLVRILLLATPMVANTLLYYLFMNVAFGYMGIILLLCMVFITPTQERCHAELNTHRP